MFVFYAFRAFETESLVSTFSLSICILHFKCIDHNTQFATPAVHENYILTSKITRQSSIIVAQKRQKFSDNSLSNSRAAGSWRSPEVRAIGPIEKIAAEEKQRSVSPRTELRQREKKRENNGRLGELSRKDRYFMRECYLSGKAPFKSCVHLSGLFGRAQSTSWPLPGLLQHLIPRRATRAHSVTH